MATRQFGKANRPSRGELIFQESVPVASTVQYPSGSDISFPKKKYKKYVLVMHNGTAVSIQSVNVVARNVSFGNYSGSETEVTAKGTSISASNTGTLSFFTDYADNDLFIFEGKIMLQWNLSAQAGSAGNIDYALYGYES